MDTIHMLDKNNHFENIWMIRWQANGRRTDLSDHTHISHVCSLAAYPSNRTPFMKDSVIHPSEHHFIHTTYYINFSFHDEKLTYSRLNYQNVNECDVLVSTVDTIE